MIKTIIFDFGDVFLNLNKEKAYNHMLNVLKIDAFTEDMIATNQAYEKGLISSNSFASFYKRKFPQLTDNSFVYAWNLILSDFPKHRLDFLLNLKAKNKYTLILLSNTNEMHINWVKKHVSFYDLFKASFDGFYLSHEIHKRKPDSSIYNYVLKNHTIAAEETFFIDDTPENTKAASALGIHTWTINPKTEDISLLLNQPAFKT